MLLSVIIPAFNEEAYIGATLAGISRASDLLREKAGISTELIVVDNDSTDLTASVARDSGVIIVKESRHNVAVVRNAGAKVASGDVLIFVDADTLVPDKLLSRIADVMAASSCFGGAVDAIYRPTKLTSRIYLRIWRIIGKLLRMAQGATQFCRKDVFFALRGYDETLYMGEDVDFFWRLKQFARQHDGSVCFIEDVQVVPSSRRFDRWRFWRTLIWTNPFFILMFRRRRAVWDGWYKALQR